MKSLDGLAAGLLTMAFIGDRSITGTLSVMAAQRSFSFKMLSLKSTRNFITCHNL